MFSSGTLCGVGRCFFYFPFINLRGDLILPTLKFLGLNYEQSRFARRFVLGLMGLFYYYLEALLG